MTDIGRIRPKMCQNQPKSFEVGPKQAKTDQHRWKVAPDKTKPAKIGRTRPKRGQNQPECINNNWPLVEARPPTPLNSPRIRKSSNRTPGRLQEIAELPMYRPSSRWRFARHRPAMAPSSLARSVGLQSARFGSRLTRAGSNMFWRDCALLRPLACAKVNGWPSVAPSGNTTARGPAVENAQNRSPHPPRLCCTGPCAHAALAREQLRVPLATPADWGRALTGSADVSHVVHAFWTNADQSQPNGIQFRPSATQCGKCSPTLWSPTPGHDGPISAKPKPRRIRAQPWVHPGGLLWRAAGFSGKVGWEVVRRPEFACSNLPAA